ncbi:uncharacterized protein LOC133204402 [Saccostrea echinata]|uniref:uncharacterized protein LOC133204402 n=1 Tax=Saccostrea echinata TaxID=191078 RepID=UPI002A8024DD|nr:uncharacterized protein LOC133204402 [Saccostrea echinata]
MLCNKCHLGYKLFKISVRKSCFRGNFQRLSSHPFSSSFVCPVSEKRSTKEILIQNYRKEKRRRILLQSFSGSFIVLMIYMYFKEDNDLDIQANIDSLKAQEKRCLDALEGRIPLGTDITREMAEEDLQRIQQELKEESQKLEGL